VKTSKQSVCHQIRKKHIGQNLEETMQNKTIYIVCS